MAIYPHPNMRKIFDIACRLDSKLAVEMSQRPVMSMPQEGAEPEGSALPDEDREFLEKLYNHPEWAGLQEMKHKGRDKSMKQTRLDQERALEIEKEIANKGGFVDDDVTRAIIAQLDARNVDPDNRPSIIGLTIDGDDAGYWVFAPQLNMYYRSKGEVALPISTEALGKLAKIQYIACKFANKTLMRPPPIEEENGETIPAPPMDIEPSSPMDTESAPAPSMPTMPSPALPAFMGKVDREVLIGDYQLISETDPDRVRQATSVYIKDKEGEILAEWLSLSGGEADLAWRVADDILKVTQN